MKKNLPFTLAIFVLFSMSLVGRVRNYNDICSGIKIEKRDGNKILAQCYCRKLSSVVHVEKDMETRKYGFAFVEDADAHVFRYNLYYWIVKMYLKKQIKEYENNNLN